MENIILLLIWECWVWIKERERPWIGEEGILNLWMKLPEISTKIWDKHSNKVRKAVAQNGIEAPSDNEGSRKRESQEKMLTCDSVHRKCSGEQNQRLKSLMLFFFLALLLTLPWKTQQTPGMQRHQHCNLSLEWGKKKTKTQNKPVREHLDKWDVLGFLLPLLQPRRKLLSLGQTDVCW